MKQILLLSLAALCALPAFAEIEGNGYYRVQNAFTKRYAYLMDDKGSYSASTSSADVAALHLYANPEKVISDPASVFFIEAAPQGNGYYDIWGQGTSIYSFMKEYLCIYKDRKEYDGQTTYSIYGSKDGVVKYLSDIWNHPEDDKGVPSVDGTGDCTRWYINPIKADSDQYFGVLPTVEAEGAYYAPMFAAFPFSAYDEGFEFYTISEIDPRGAAIIEKVDGTIPGATPVVIKCPAALPTDNRLNIGGTPSKIGTNVLKGVYFDNNVTNVHYNRTEFNKETMRVLGVAEDGSVAFVRGDYDFIPRNQAYLQLTDPASYLVDDFILMTSEERDDYFNAVAIIPATETVSVYSLDGRLLKSGITKSDVPSLGKGLYILKGAGVSEKMIVR